MSPGWRRVAIDHVASLVITGILPREPVSDGVEAFWLAWELLADEEWTVTAGDVLAVTEGARAVAYLTVERVEIAEG